MESPTVAILTPPEPGAIAVLLVEAPDAATLVSALGRAGVRVPELGRLLVGSIAGVDEGVVVRWTPNSLQLSPHAGPAVVEEVVRRLDAAGVRRVSPEDLDPRSIYPEAADLLEARMLWTLSRASSRLAIDLLLDQPRRWRAPGAASDSSRDRILSRLISPPTVAAFGPPNIGKSTLCNALAGRSVAIVADEPGTTRDHVGVLIDCGGLVVRYIDTPGMTSVGARPGASRDEAAAVRLTRAVLASADLILRCGDAGTAPLDVPAGLAPFAGAITVALRADLGHPGFASDLVVAAATGGGLADLGDLLRERLVPRRALESTLPWRFW